MGSSEKLNEVIALILKLSLDKLNSDWVKNVIDADFTEVEDIPLDFEEFHSCTNFRGLFDAIACSLRPIIDSIKDDLNTSYGTKRSSLSVLCTSSICEEDSENRDIFSSFWINLSHSLKIKRLMTFLLYYIQRGQRYDATEDIREMGIQVACLYFLLLSIPGSNTFRLFHPILYLKTLDILKLTTKLNIGAASPKKGGHRSSKLSHRKSADENIDANEEDEAEISFLTPAEASKLIRSLNILLNDFLRFLKRFSLKHCPESLDETINVLVEVTRCEITNAQEIFLNRHGANTVSSLAYNAYVALQNVCDNLHGNEKKTITMIMKNLLNNVLMIPRGSSDLSNRALGVIREHTLIFIKYLLIQLGKAAHEAVYILVQHLCLKVPDKADFREKTAKSVIDILKVLPISLYSQLLKWLFKLSHNEKAGHRLFTLEVISKLLCESERQTEIDNSLSLLEKETQPPELINSISSEESNESSKTSPDGISIPNNRHILSHKFLLSIIFSRCRDSAATVRSKALVLLAECTLSEKPVIVESIKQIFFQCPAPVVFNTPHIPNNDINCESPLEDFANVLEFPNAEVVMSMLRRRALDEKVTVRKSALQVMENLMKIYPQMLSRKYLNVLVNHCRDTALFIRKQMVTSIASLVETYPMNEEVVNTWTLGVLPLILDPEAKVQEKVVEQVDILILRRIEPYSKNSNDELPWKILNAITKLSFHKFFTKVALMWSKSDYMKPQIIHICKSHIGFEFNEQAWTLLAMLSQYIPVKNPSFALDYFEENCSLTGDVCSYTLQQVMKVLCCSIKHIPHERALVLHETLLAPIVDNLINVELISAMVDTLALLTYKLDGEDEAGQKAIEYWAAPILKSCDDYLKKVLFPNDPKTLSKEEEEIFFRRLYTLGEVALLCPSKVNKRMFLMMQSIIFHQDHLKKSNDIVEIPSTQTQSSQPPAVSFTPTRRLKALAVVTLGKMCLQHEDQAKRIVPALGKMLDTTALSSIKINIIFVLSDMCVRYATLVDPLMPQVTACLRDNDIQVRRTTLTLLINLLQEDYLKLKGSFFYRILQCLTDDHEDIKSTVIFFMVERLLKRYPKIFLQHFIECIFHYNCYEEHESYNKFCQSTQEKELFSLAGPEHREKRMDLYRFMLDNMQDDQRFATTQKLCQDVLGGVVDGRIKLTASSLPMLEDTLMVLSSEEIKLAWLKSKPGDTDQPTDQAEQAEMAGIVIKKTIISQVVKRNVIENIVPIMITLKHKLAEQRSPLMKQLLLYFKEIMKDYKSEVKEILAGDKQFAKEIEFDLRKFEQDQQNELVEKETEARANARKGNPTTANNEPLSSKTKPVSYGNSPKLAARVISEINDIADEETESSVTDMESSSNPDTATPNPKTATPNLKTAMFNLNSLTPNPSNIASPNPNSERPNSPNTVTPNSSNTAMPNINTAMPNINTAVPNSPNTATSDHGTPENRSKPVFRRRSDSTTLLKQALINSQKVIRQRRRTTLERIEEIENLSISTESVKEEINVRDLRRELTLIEDGISGTEDSHNDSDQLHREIIGVGLVNNDNHLKTLGTTLRCSVKLTRLEEIAPVVTKVESSSKHEPNVSSMKQSPKPINRADLLRAISTPQPNQKVISNVTFINRTQEVSAIGINDSQLSTISVQREDGSSPQTLLLHFRSPEAFAKDEQFSKLRRGTKRSLTSEFSKRDSELGRIPLRETTDSRKSSNTSNTKSKSFKKPSGGFMESFSKSDNSSLTSSKDSDDSELSVLSRVSSFGNLLTKKNKIPKLNELKVLTEAGHSKRNREAASLSPRRSKNVKTINNDANSSSSKKTRTRSRR